jgi:hypothetical protein
MSAYYEGKPQEQVYSEYRELLNDSVTRTIPHCDSDVLHSLGTCEYCDKRPELQGFRHVHQMQFTNEEFDPQLHNYPCPSFERRPLGNIERWPGNRPHSQVFGKLT